MDLNGKLKKLSLKTRFTPAEKKLVADLCAKHGVKLRDCKCPNKYRDAVCELYAKVVERKELLTPNDEIRYVGVGDVEDSRYGRLGKTTARSKAESIYREDYGLFKRFFAIIKKKKEK